MTVVQVWGCKNCQFTYESEVKLKALEHHCVAKSRKVIKSILIDEPKLIVTRKPEPEKPKGRVLKRRSVSVK